MSISCQCTHYETGFHTNTTLSGGVWIYSCMWSFVLFTSCVLFPANCICGNLVKTNGCWVKIAQLIVPSGLACFKLFRPYNMLDCICLNDPCCLLIFRNQLRAEHCVIGMWMAYLRVEMFNWTPSCNLLTLSW